MKRVKLPAVWRIAWNTLPGEYILSDIMGKGRIIFSRSLSSECGGHPPIAEK